MPRAGLSCVSDLYQEGQCVDGLWLLPAPDWYISRDISKESGSNLHSTAQHSPQELNQHKQSHELDGQPGEQQQLAQHNPAQHSTA
jgi:hypothetical protein